MFRNESKKFCFIKVRARGLKISLGQSTNTALEEAKMLVV